MRTIIAVFLLLASWSVAAQDGERLGPDDPGYWRSSAPIRDFYCPSPDFIEDVRTGAYDDGKDSDIFLMCSEIIIRALVNADDTRAALLELMDIMLEERPIE